MQIPDSIHNDRLVELVTGLLGFDYDWGRGVHVRSVEFLPKHVVVEYDTPRTAGATSRVVVPVEFDRLKQVGA